MHVTSNPWSKLTQACEAWATAALNSEGAEWLSGKDGHKSVQTLTLNTRDSDNINVFCEIQAPGVHVNINQQ